MTKCSQHNQKPKYASRVKVESRRTHEHQNRSNYHELTLDFFLPQVTEYSRALFLSFLFYFRLSSTRMNKNLPLLPFCYSITKHFMTQNNIYYLCHTYAITPIKICP
ncbi:hypothetical protein V6Z11_A02G152700 [Gossypium hirsutum]